MLHLDYRDIRPSYAQITDEVRQQIAAGVLVLYFGKRHVQKKREEEMQ